MAPGCAPQRDVSRGRQVIHSIPAVLASLVPLRASNAFWLPEEGTAAAGQVDWLFNLILGISVFFFALIAVLTIYFLLRYRRRQGIEAGQPPTHHTWLEITWTVIPTIIVIVIFYFGFTGYMDMKIAPENALEIQVTGQKWQWLFSYPNGHVDPDLHVPVDQPVKLIMTSEDVIHGFFIPDFRQKMDVVPGRYSTVWFNVSRPGKHIIFCTQYCGRGHSDMSAWVVVHPPGEYEKWLTEVGDEISKLPPAEAGEKLYLTRGCKQCHTIDGGASTGPSFLGMFGRSETMKDGAKLTVDENYIREAIIDPQAKIVAGYQPVMPTYKGKLKDNEITVIIEYLKTLKR
ncbi:MAG: cytochrome c oxidase subunit II [candidate division Zixibacteria bacterium]|nr:cytochrome c oxidase subunit II [candidate division Zixibacteria bacterium]